MAYKDEYEVARLYTDGRFHEELAQEFEGKPILRFHLAPPILGNQDRQERPVKRTFGPWMLHCFRMLATLRRLRGTPLDVFGMTAERRAERQLIDAYRNSIEAAIDQLNAANIEIAIAIAHLPEQIRGYGHVKLASMAAAQVRWNALTQEFAALRDDARECERRSATQLASTTGIH
jgi:indolepyruvate ferredoxin oxidoreductase